MSIMYFSALAHSGVHFMWDLYFGIGSIFLMVLKFNCLAKESFIGVQVLFREFALVY